MRLSLHFSLDELTASDWAARQGVDNSCPHELMPHLHRTAEGLERIRAHLGYPVNVSSGYRSPAVNAGVGGSANSQHMKAEAADITCPMYGSAADLAQELATHKEALGIDQIILEFGRWVHVSFTERPRFSVLTIKNKVSGYQEGVIV